MIKICKICHEEYDDQERKGKPGKVTECQDCTENDIEKYSGNMIYSHKTGSSIQINKSKELTNYINNVTKLKNKGSNMHHNTVASSKKHNKTHGECLVVCDSFSFKGKSE